LKKQHLNMMRYTLHLQSLRSPRALVALAMLVTGSLVMTSCGSNVQLVMVVTGTPDPNSMIITKTPVPATATTAAPQEPAVAVSTITPSPIVVMVTATQPETLSPNVATPLPAAYPTETRAEIRIAQQDFQNGYMFWISSTQPSVIWVLLNGKEGPVGSKGEWRIYPDTFVDGQAEFDPAITPPDGLFQPRRGFGKLWRETPGLREAMGWALTPELGLTTPYVYQPGGFIDANNVYQTGPGRHFLQTSDRKTFVFYESAEGVWRWERIN
jgi:hypothetical protein